MHVMITGAAGMIGRKLAEQLARNGGLSGKAIDRFTLADIVAPTKPAGFAGAADLRTCDLSTDGEAVRLIGLRPDVIFHLAAVVSGEAEADFEKGYRINLDGTRSLLEAVRLAGEGYKPRVVYSSSVAVFGAPFPETVGDDFFTTPLSSYGTQKAINELLLSDYSRRGFLDGIGLRLPTICIRPGKPNKAASGFFSGIMREPLSGQEAILPVPEDVRHWCASPRAAISFLIRAAEIDLNEVGDRRNLSMPGLSVTIRDQIDALRRAAGDGIVKLIRHEPDAAITRIVAGWPPSFDAKRAIALGFKADASFDAIVQAYIEDEKPSMGRA
jgi:D-erythronate 2-dehydrogenase